MTTREIEAHAHAWRRRMFVRELTFAVAAALVVGALTLLLANDAHRIILAVASALLAMFGTAFIRLARVAPWTIDSTGLARHLDRQYPELEESSRLWLRPPESLSLVEKLQLMRLDRAFANIPQAAQSPAAPPTGMLRRAGGWLFAGGILALLAVVWTLMRPAQPSEIGSRSSMQPPANPTTGSAAIPAAPRIDQAEISITPPAYTQRPPRKLDNLNAEVEEGSTVAWRVKISGGSRDVKLRFGDSGRDSLPFQQVAPGQFETHRVITDSALYSIAGTLANGELWEPSEIHYLKVIKDRAPTVRFIEPVAPRTEVAPPAAQAGPASVTVRVAAVDDYGVSGAHLVATVAKGTGEAVKFREQIIAFDPVADSTGAPATREFVKTLDLVALGLEPGDELYFHVAARDNREPEANRARSETRFVLLQGPDGKMAAPGLGVSGVNLVPPYFRSQRQLIIDTEKLIADRPTLSDAEFRERSNDLGIDQQLLRLRYGQFLGEELEEGAGAHADTGEPGAAPTNAAGVPLDMMHQHDRGPEGADAMATREADKSKPSRGVPATPAEIMEPYVDQHDSQDEATFHDSPTKDSLRNALAAMWESEGFLRTSRPAEALPAENRALEILKALQQSARAYVQRVGFEPAPLKISERRLQGDVAKVERLARAEDTPVTMADVNKAVREALRSIWWQRPTGDLRASETAALKEAEPRLVDAATRDPAAALAGLQSLRLLVAGGANVTKQLPVVERALWQLLPPARPLPNRSWESSPELGQIYFRSLQTEEAKP